MSTYDTYGETPTLGRRFAGHDQRSRQYGVRPALTAAPLVRRPTYWRLPAGPFPLDQGAEGACTGYGIAHELAASPVVVPGITASYALARYLRNRDIDRELGNEFPDGASVLATMKAARADGLITGYRWAFGVDDVVDTLCTVGPVCLGVEWRDGMYQTDALGRVRLDGAVVGGHFIVAVGYDVHPQWGPCVIWVNSWGPGYGVACPSAGVRGGAGWITVADLATLLAADGEAVVPADYLPPPPVPVPSPAPRRPASWREWLRRLLNR